MENIEFLNFINDSDITNQVLVNDRPSIHLNIYSKITNSIYKVICENNVGTGFLLKTKKGKNDFYCIITCEHVITKDMIEKEKKVSIENNHKSFSFYLDKTERFIRDYTYMNIDSTLIEISPEKLEIPIENFLLPHPEICDGYDKFKNTDAYIAHFPLNGELKINEGSIIDIDKYSFQLIHNINTQKGSSGGGIFEKDSMFVLAIHTKGSKNKKQNYAFFISPIIDSLKKDNDYTEMKYYYLNDTLYEGELRNNLREGYGKLILKNGNYYKGQWCKDMMQGLGVLYSKDDNIIYKGEFKNNDFNGYGIYIFDNRDYYIGNFFNSKRHGLGRFYNKNNKLKYNGNYKNDIKEGKGIYYWEDGVIYNGYFINLLFL